jgi:hypothetical protein
MPAFTIEHLDEHKLLDAWPILRSAGAEPLPDWWENEALELMERGGGVLAARAPDGSVHGVATYECVHRPSAGSVLAVDRLVTFELNRKEPVKEALREALHRIASAFCCTCVALPLPDRGVLKQRIRQIYGEEPLAGRLRRSSRDRRTCG